MRWSEHLPTREGLYVIAYATDIHAAPEWLRAVMVERETNGTMVIVDYDGTPMPITDATWEAREFRVRKRQPTLWLGPLDMPTTDDRARAIREVNAEKIAELQQQIRELRGGVSEAAETL